MKKTLIATALLSLCGCSQNQIVQSLEAVVNASVAVVPAVEKAANVPAGTQVAIGNYLDAVRQCVDVAQKAVSTHSELTATQQGLAIAAGCSGQLSASPALPPGTAQEVASAVSVVASAVQAFLSGLQPAANAHAIGAPPDPAVYFDPRKLAKVAKGNSALTNHVTMLKSGALGNSLNARPPGSNRSETTDKWQYQTSTPETTNFPGDLWRGGMSVSGNSRSDGYGSLAAEWINSGLNEKQGFVYTAVPPAFGAGAPPCGGRNEYGPPRRRHTRRAIRRICAADGRSMDPNGVVQISIVDGQFLEVQISDLEQDYARGISQTMQSTGGG